MPRIWTALLVVVPSCAGSAPPPKNPKPIVRLLELMQSNDTLNERLMYGVRDKTKKQKDFDRYLGAIRQNMIAARSVDYHDDAEKEKEFDAEFDRFILDLDEAARRDWTKDGSEAWRRLQDSCTRCHDRFSED